MAAPKRKYGYNPTPRLSANQLAEYLNAESPRRKAIVREAKFPKTSIVARYDWAREGIAKFLCDDGRNGVVLVDVVENLKLREARATASDWTKDDCRLSIEAIESFRRSYNKLGLTKISCKAVPGQLPKLLTEDVDVSVALDATTHRKDKDGVDRVGGVILLFSKSETSTKNRQERCRTNAVLALLFAEKHLKHKGQVDPKICFGVDIFGGKSHPAPGSYAKRLTKMEASCEEVALRWPKTKPPADYDGPAPNS